MDRKLIDDRRMVARYLADQLSGDEREAFEAYLLEHPDVVQELEHTARLKVGLQRLQASGRLEGLLADRPWHREPRFYAWAASIVLVVGALFLWFGARVPSQPILVASLSALKDHAGQPLPVTTTRTVLRTRGIEYDAEIDATAIPTVVELRVLPEFQPQPPVYRASLSYIGDDGVPTERAALSGLSAGLDGYVTLFLDASALVPGRYELSLNAGDGVASPETTSNFSIRVKPVR